MKKFNVTVNGNTYEVEVEEVGTTNAAQSLPVAPKAAPAPVQAPAAPKSAPAAAPAQVAAGDTTVNAPMPGKVTKIVAAAGQAVKKGEVILILEAMKMQNEIGAPVDGTLKSINVAAGQSVKPGEVMAVIG